MACLLRKLVSGRIIAMLKKHPIQSKRVVLNSRFKMISLADARSDAIHVSNVSESWRRWGFWWCEEICIIKTWSCKAGDVYLMFIYLVYGMTEAVTWDQRTIWQNPQENSTAIKIGKGSWQGSPKVLCAVSALLRRYPCNHCGRARTCKNWTCEKRDCFGIKTTLTSESDSWFLRVYLMKACEEPHV